MKWNNIYPKDRFGEINDCTGFANGEPFESEEEVREYFNRESLIACLDPEWLKENEFPSQESLDYMADLVIKYRWNMTDAN